MGGEVETWRHGGFGRCSGLTRLHKWHSRPWFTLYRRMEFNVQRVQRLMSKMKVVKSPIFACII